MSLDRLGEDGLDRLADYLAGALDDGQADRVAHLVATDPDWRAAYAELAMADRSVRALLQAESDRSAEPMPAAVAARIDAALNTAGRAEHAPRTPADRVAAPAPRVVSLDEHRSSRRRWLAGLVVAAAAIGVVGVGLSLRSIPLAVPSTTAEGGANDNVTKNQAGPNVAAAPTPTYINGTPVIITHVQATGTEYTQDTLAALARGKAMPSAAGSVPAPAASPPSLRSPSFDRQAPSRSELAEKGVDALARLLDPAALAACSNAISDDYPGVVISIDYARFNDAPALILVVYSALRGTQVVAVGPDCGIAGMDKLAAAGG